MKRQEVLNFKNHTFPGLNMCAVSNGTQICDTEVTWWWPLKGSTGPGLEHKSRPFEVLHETSESNSQTNQRISWLLLFLLDCPTQLPRSDLTSQEGQENFWEPRGIWKPRLSRMSIVLIQPVRSRTWHVQNFLGWWDIFRVHPKVQREGSKPSHLPEERII